MKKPLLQDPYVTPDAALSYRRWGGSVGFYHHICSRTKPCWNWGKHGQMNQKASPWYLASLGRHHHPPWTTRPDGPRLQSLRRGCRDTQQESTCQIFEHLNKTILCSKIKKVGKDPLSWIWTEIGVRFLMNSPNIFFFQGDLWITSLTWLARCATVQTSNDVMPLAPTSFSRWVTGGLTLEMKLVILRQYHAIVCPRTSEQTLVCLLSVTGVFLEPYPNFVGGLTRNEANHSLSFQVGILYFFATKAHLLVWCGCCVNLKTTAPTITGDAIANSGRIIRTELVGCNSMKCIWFLLDRYDSNQSFYLASSVWQDSLWSQHFRLNAINTFTITYLLFQMIFLFFTISKLRAKILTTHPLGKEQQLIGDFPQPAVVQVCPNGFEATVCALDFTGAVTAIGHDEHTERWISKGWSARVGS